MSFYTRGPQLELCRRCIESRSFLLDDNYLTGSIPPVLLDKFGPSSFASNCLDDCSIVRQASCAPINVDSAMALVDLYNSTNGDGWLSRDNWLQGDPCFNAWAGVTCIREQGSCVSNVW